MKKEKTKISLGLWLVVFWIFAGMLEHTVKEWSLETLLCDLNKEGQQLFDTSTLEKLKEEEGKRDNRMQASAWTREPQVLVENHSLDRKEYADCISVWSNSSDGISDMLSRRMSGGRLLGGTYGFAGNQESCWISSSLAFELFGSIDVTGKRLWCYGEERRIEGVIKGEQPQIWILARKEETFPYLLLKYGNKEEKSDHIKQLVTIREVMTRYGFSDNVVIISGNRMYFLVRFLFYLPLWVLSAWIFCGYRQMALRTKRLTQLLIQFITLTALCYLFWVLTEKSIWLPSDFIPTRWSDFGFYADKARDIRKQARDIHALLPVMWFESWKIMTGLTFLCSICAGIGIKLVCSWFTAHWEQSRF